MPRATTVHAVTTIGMDMGKNTLHMIGLDSRGAIVLREKVSRGRITSRLANVPSCLIGIEAGMATHYVARELAALGHDVKQVPPAYAKPFRQGHKNDFRDAHAVAEAVQRPTTRCVPGETGPGAALADPVVRWSWLEQSESSVAARPRLPRGHLGNHSCAPAETALHTSAAPASHRGQARQARERRSALPFPLRCRSDRMARSQASMLCVRVRPSPATRWRRANRGRSCEVYSCPYPFRWWSLREP